MIDKNYYKTKNYLNKIINFFQNKNGLLVIKDHLLTNKFTIQTTIKSLYHKKTIVFGDRYGQLENIKDKVIAEFPNIKYIIIKSKEKIAHEMFSKYIDEHKRFLWELRYVAESGLSFNFLKKYDLTQDEFEEYKKTYEEQFENLHQYEFILTTINMSLSYKFQKLFQNGKYNIIYDSFKVLNLNKIYLSQHQSNNDYNYSETIVENLKRKYYPEINSQKKKIKNLLEHELLYKSKKKDFGTYFFHYKLKEEYEIFKEILPYLAIKIYSILNTKKANVKYKESINKIYGEIIKIKETNNFQLNKENLEKFKKLFMDLYEIFISVMLKQKKKIFQDKSITKDDNDYMYKQINIKELKDHKLFYLCMLTYKKFAYEKQKVKGKSSKERTVLYTKYPRFLEALIKFSNFNNVILINSHFNKKMFEKVCCFYFYYIPEFDLINNKTKNLNFRIFHKSKFNSSPGSMYGKTNHFFKETIINKKGKEVNVKNNYNDLIKELIIPFVCQNKKICIITHEEHVVKFKNIHKDIFVGHYNDTKEYYKYSAYDLFLIIGTKDFGPLFNRIDQYFYNFDEEGGLDFIKKYNSNLKLIEVLYKVDILDKDKILILLGLIPNSFKHTFSIVENTLKYGPLYELINREFNLNKLEKENDEYFYLLSNVDQPFYKALSKYIKPIIAEQYCKPDERITGDVENILKRFRIRFIKISKQDLFENFKNIKK